MNILTLVVSALVFGIVILVHELGHYLVAKHNGIRVLEFSIGMGPAIWQTEKNGTNYSLRLLPVGGFVSMEGEDEDGELLEDCVRQPEKEKASEQSYGSVEQNIPFPLARPKKRIAVLLAGACMNFLLGFLALWAVNAASAVTGIALGLNLWNALVVGVLGLPGFVLLLLVQWVL